MSREFIHIQLSGPTASYRVPTAISGTQLALEAPPYSSILGMLSYAAGREVTPDDTRIGYRYKYLGKGLDLETIHRWDRRNSGSYGYNDTNIRKREIHYHIQMDIYLDNVDLLDEIDQPSRQLSFGRSQDLATIELIHVVNAEKVDSGRLAGTLLPIEVGEDIPANGMFYNLPENFRYMDGKVRRAQNIRSFLALPQNSAEVMFDDLWQVSHPTEEEQVFYLHLWRTR